MKIDKVERVYFDMESYRHFRSGRDVVASTERFLDDDIFLPIKEVEIIEGISGSGGTLIRVKSVDK